MNKLISFFLCLMISGGVVLSQTNYTLSSGSSKMKITGGANVHEWDETVNKLSGDARITIGSDVFDIISLNFKADVKSIESSKGSIMDDKTYEALKASKYPYITFELDKVLKASPVSNGYWLNTQGYLTIAGSRKLVKLDVKAIYTDASSIAFEGTKTFNMSEFGIDPPTAMMGSMKVKDEVKIQFKVYYK
ncbi:MAG TPA: hypothetical protein DCG24_02300 [Bacteroidetes bacterium]|nr:hypothetical protein [Bacteroidota bacterium]